MADHANSPRLLAVKSIHRVLLGESLTKVLEDIPSSNTAMGKYSITPQDRHMVSFLCHGVLRWHPRMAAIVNRLIKHPLKAKDQIIEVVLWCGVYQLLYTDMPPYAVVNESVNLANALRKPWASGLINATLRNLLRQKEQFDPAHLDQAEEISLATAHPGWLVERIQQDWPDAWQAIIQANNALPPLTLRVNARKKNREDYACSLEKQGIAAEQVIHTTHGICLLDHYPVHQLPGFQDGDFSVQDGAAQMVAPLLELAAGQRVLDACAAPGGKTAHLLEYQEGLTLWALDIHPHRQKMTAQTLARLGLAAHLITADAAEPELWWEGQPFDRILLDAPCSGTGVMRRHPDIKWLRRPEDMITLKEQQARLLNRLWPLLAQGGLLLYVTCSILAEENRQQMDLFLQTHDDAEPQSLDVPWGQISGTGRQILPGENSMDGFFFCLIKKR